jgi:hypothetical protein
VSLHLSGRNWHTAPADGPPAMPNALMQPQSANPAKNSPCSGRPQRLIWMFALMRRYPSEPLSFCVIVVTKSLAFQYPSPFIPFTDQVAEFLSLYQTIIYLHCPSHSNPFTVTSFHLFLLPVLLTTPIATFLSLSHSFHYYHCPGHSIPSTVPVILAFHCPPLSIPFTETPSLHSFHCLSYSMSFNSFHYYSHSIPFTIPLILFLFLFPALSQSFLSYHYPSNLIPFTVSLSFHSFCLSHSIRRIVPAISFSSMDVPFRP